MCWSGEASIVLAVGGGVFSAYAAYKKESYRLYAPLAYFSLMELLQGFTYSVIDQCSLPSNQISTVFGYLHIAFQPFFINMIAMYFIPDSVRKRVESYVYIICFVATIFMLLQLYPFEWAGQCIQGTFLCSDYLCSVSGNWHISWEIPVNGLANIVLETPVINHILTGYPSYVIAGFFVPLLYGSWRLTLYNILIGPVLSMQLTDNPNEAPAIWCLMSIAILVVVIKTPIRQYMFCHNWFLWPRSWLLDSRKHTV